MDQVQPISTRLFCHSTDCYSWVPTKRGEESVGRMLLAQAVTLAASAKQCVAWKVPVSSAFVPRLTVCAGRSLNERAMREHFSSPVISLRAPFIISLGGLLTSVRVYQH